MKLPIERAVNRKHSVSAISWDALSFLDTVSGSTLAQYNWHKSNIPNPPVGFDTADKLAYIFAALESGMLLRDIAIQLNCFPSTLGAYVDRYFVKMPTDYESRMT